ncbi:MAG: hypothetical protein ACR2ML_03655 [Solirubrobacteraceae bacterium]
MQPNDHQPKRLAVTLTVLAAAVLALAACGTNEDTTKPGDSKPSSAAPVDEMPQATVKVAEAEYSLKPTPATGKAGEVTFDVENAGSVKHEFVVIKTDKKANELLKGDEADEQGTVDEIGDIEPGKSAELAVKLEPGHYALICNLPGHYMPGGKPGMLADFTVR